MVAALIGLLLGTNLAWVYGYRRLIAARNKLTLDVAGHREALEALANAFNIAAPDDLAFYYACIKGDHPEVDRGASVVQFDPEAMDEIVRRPLRRNP